MPEHEVFLAERLLPWARQRPDVRAVGEMGSRTRDEPPDEWADMDLVLLVADTAPFLDSDTWISEITEPWISVGHPGPFPGLPVRQIVFPGGLDFDIVPIRAGTLADRLADPHIAAALEGGFRPLLDKDGELAAVPALGAPPATTPAHVSEEEFRFVIADFLFQVVWAAKHLRRGELWAAKDDVDGYMKGDLIRLIEWHTLAHRPGTRIRSGGRYLETWADQRIIAQLPEVFAAYNAPSVAQALIEMTGLFHWVAVETADLLGYDYPEVGHRAVVSWAKDCLEDYL